MITEVLLAARKHDLFISVSNLALYGYLGCAELHPVPAVPGIAVADGGGGAGGLAPLHTQGSRLQGGEGQPHLQVNRGSCVLEIFGSIPCSKICKKKVRKSVVKS